MSDEPEELGVCPHCQQPVLGDREYYEDPEGGIWHMDCYETHQLEELTDVYNRKGVKGLKELEALDELDHALGLS